MFDLPIPRHEVCKTPLTFSSLTIHYRIDLATGERMVVKDGSAQIKGKLQQLLS
jgi:hypothetical protein